MNFSELTCYLIKGAFYKCGHKIYLIGENVPCIANVWAQEVNSDGDLIGDIEAMYYRQRENWKILKDGILIKDKYKENLQELFCHDYTDFVNKKRKHELPPVYHYLECGQINSIKKYAISKGEKEVNKFMSWLKDNCRYYSPYNQLIYYNMITNKPIGHKSNEELYDIYKRN